MNTRRQPAAAPGPTEARGWMPPAPATGLGRLCPSCRPSGRRRGPDPRRWLEGIPRFDTDQLEQLAFACTLVGYEHHTATIERVAALARRARMRAQQLFPYGLGPVLGDLMLPADGGGDMLRALTDLAESLFAHRRPPRTYPVCPWGSTDRLSCGRDLFGRLVHDHCHAPTGPVPAWRAKSWAVWTWRTACALDRLPPRLIQHRDPQPVDVSVPGGRVGPGMIGPIVLVIGRDGPAQRARASHHVLTALIMELKPDHVDTRAALFGLHGHLKPAPGGPFVWGWHGYAPRSLFTAALQARHASVHHGPDDIVVGHFARHVAPDRRRERVAQGLLEEGWDEQVRTDDELRALLRAAFRAATSADTELWERTARGRRVVRLDDADLIAGSGAVDPDPGLKEEVGIVLDKLSPEEREVAFCYATGLTWKQAALKVGQKEKMGNSVRRKLQRQGTEYLRRRH
ncbi:hypothetical protein GCM10010425_49140 [Streptomyces spororaveus]|uniref:DNA-directed RNA polymerase specialized sigma24 family protein n=1 Tax=Streptomyces spororaveus TaxID=284039 RepID=A0ABQ3T290_9ACTN|nr:hypothetical protein [Streptomyces spororaveus]GHI74508.1 hypothetical protein Sspor_00690 [Streptomyces spororaveus]